jgi:hypothetical protein
LLEELAKQQLVDFLPGTISRRDLVLLRADRILDKGSKGTGNHSEGTADRNHSSGQFEGSREGGDGSKQHACRQPAERERSCSHSREHGRRVPYSLSSIPSDKPSGGSEQQQQQQKHKQEAARSEQVPLLVPMLVPSVVYKTFGPPVLHQVKSSWRLIGRTMVVRGMRKHTNGNQIRVFLEG